MDALIDSAAMDGRFVIFAIKDDRRNTTMDGRFVILRDQG